jgi:integrase
MTGCVLDRCVEANALLVDYLEYVAGLSLSGRAVRDRTRIAREFLSRNPDLAAWMVLPAASRAAELRSTGAWPLVCYAIGAGQVRLDVELAAVRHLTGLGAAVEARDPAGFAALREAGNRLGWTSSWIETVLAECLAVVLACHGGLVANLTRQMIDDFDAALLASSIPRSSRRAYRARLASLRQLLYETRVLDTAPRRRIWARSLEQRFTDVAMAQPIRDTLLRYIRARTAVLRPRSVESLVNDMLPFAEYLTAHHPQLTSLNQLDRACVEGYLAWNRTRGWRGQRAAAGAGRTISAAVAQSAVLSLRNLLDDITAWGWQEAPARRLVFAADVPKLDQPLPRALAPDVDAAVMNAIARLEDRFARVGLTVLRGAGLRAGELVDLELGSIIDYGPAGTWLKVPLGKLATERMVPLSTGTIAALDEWVALRGVHRPLPHPRTGVLTDFLFTQHGRRLGYTRLRNGLLTAVESAGLRAPDGGVLVITPHQLRHTWATELANAGMSLQALMALLGHVTPQMTLRYATLASPTLRAAYDQAMGKMRRQFTLTPARKPILPDKVGWLHAEMLKTRVAHGYCARHPAAGACPYANICETCDNYITAPEFRDALTDQLADVQDLKTDAENRGWTDEAARHDRVADASPTTSNASTADTPTYPRLTRPPRAG